MVAILEHYRPTTADHEPGVYRVVGTGDPVVLLRVGDGDGRRVHTGRVVAVDRPLDGFEPADPPAEGLLARLRALVGS